VEQELLTLPKHHRSPSVFNEVCVVWSLVFCVMFCRSLFILLLLAIMLSVLLRFKASDYPFGIFKLFLYRLNSQRFTTLGLYIKFGLYRILISSGFCLDRLHCWMWWMQYLIWKCIQNISCNCIKNTCVFITDSQGHQGKTTAKMLFKTMKTCI